MAYSIYSTAKRLKGDVRLNVFFYLIAISLHLFILIYLNSFVIENIFEEKEEELVYVKNLPPSETKLEKLPGPISKSMASMGNAASAGGGGGSKIKIDDRLIEKELEQVSPEKLKELTPEQLKDILPEIGDQDLKDIKEEAKPEVKQKELNRSKANRPVIQIKKGAKFGIKGGRGTIRSFESAMGAGLFGKPTGEGTGLGSGTGSGFGPGSGGGWGGGHGGGIGDGIGEGWQGGGMGGSDVDAIIKSNRIIKTTVRVFVLPDGSVDKVDVLKSSGFMELDNLAKENAGQNIYDALQLKPGDEEKIRIYDVEIEFSQIR